MDVSIVAMFFKFSWSMKGLFTRKRILIHQSRMDLAKEAIEPLSKELDAYFSKQNWTKSSEQNLQTLREILPFGVVLSITELQQCNTQGIFLYHIPTC